MKPTRIGRFLPIFFLLAWSCREGAPADGVLATYRGGAITEEEYNAWKLSIGREPDKNQRSRALQTIAINKTLAASRENEAVTEPHLKMALLDLETELLARELKRRLAAEVEIDPREIERALVQRRDKFTLPRRVRLRNISKRLAKGTREEKAALRAQMEEIRRELLDGADFERMVEAESESQTRFHKGYMGFIRPGQLEPAVEAVAMELHPGELSPVLETEGWLTLLRCEEIAEEHRPSDEKIRANLTAKFRKAEMEKKLQSLREDILREAEIDVSAFGEASASPEPYPLVLPDGRRFSAAEARALLSQKDTRQDPSKMSPARLQTTLEDWAEQMGAAARARELGLDDAQWRATMHWRRLAILANFELKERVKARFVPFRELEIREFYEANQDLFKFPEQFKLVAIAMRAEPSEVRDRYYQAEKILAEIRAGRLPLEEAAARFSGLPSAADGGSMGWLSRQQIASFGPNVLGTVVNLQPGEISELIQQQESLLRDATFWIVKLVDKRPSRPMSYEQAKKQVANQLGNRRTREVQQQVLAELSAELDLNILDSGE